MRRTIYRSEHLHAFATYPHPPSDDLVVIAFQHRAENLTLDSPGFGESFFNKQNTPSVHVNCRSNAWWQYDDLPACLASVKSVVSNFTKRVTYGSSMGGYAALRFADAIGANAVISASPQYSPRSEVISLETRYQTDIENVAFIHENTSQSFEDIPRYLLFDPYFPADKAHAHRYLQHGRVTLVPMPAAGHPCLLLLAEQGTLKDVLLKMMNGTFDVSLFASQQHSVRRSTYRYLNQLSFRLADRRKFRLAYSVAKESVRLFPEKKDEAFSFSLTLCTLCRRLS
jgi:hypothetical protein